MQREIASDAFPLGSTLPKFSLPATDGRSIGSDYLTGAKGALVVFTCNHCPYVKGSEALLIETVRRFEAKGLRAVAISANDPVQYPEDSFENMKAKAKSLALPFPYLFDESQQTAKAFDAACTPECYLFDARSKLVFHGAITDNPKDPGAKRRNFLAEAVEQLLSAKPVQPGFVHPLGCSIKWKH
jgi:peroxiredoxin